MTLFAVFRFPRLLLPGLFFAGVLVGIALEHDEKYCFAAPQRQSQLLPAAPDTKAADRFWHAVPLPTKDAKGY